jgi:phage terminase small subunit
MNEAQINTAVAHFDEEVPTLPEHLEFKRNRDKIWFKVYSETRIVQDWRPIDLCELFSLCEATVDLEEERAALRTEGAVIATETGNSTSNPRIHLIKSLEAKIDKLKDALGINTDTMHSKQYANRRKSRA